MPSTCRFAITQLTMVNSMASEMSSFPLSMALWPRRLLGFVRARLWYCNMHGIVHFRLGQQVSNTSSRQETCNERTNWSFSRHRSIVSHPQSRWPLIEILNRGENELNRRAAEFHRNQPSKWMHLDDQLTATWAISFMFCSSLSEDHDKAKLSSANSCWPSTNHQTQPRHHLDGTEEYVYAEIWFGF